MQGMTDILEAIKHCVSQRKIFWTYHVMMRMDGRFVPRHVILDAVQSYELLETYPEGRRRLSLMEANYDNT